MLAMLIWIVILALARRIEANVLVDTQITELIKKEKQGLDGCKETTTQNVLYILEQTYGFACVLDDGSDKGELVFTTCIVDRNGTDVTYLSDKDLANVISLEGLTPTFTGAALSGDMWKACEYLKTNWNTNKEKIKAANIFTPTATNIERASEWTEPNKDAVNVSKCDSKTVEVNYLIYGASLFSCENKDQAPEFVGCIQGPLDKHKMIPDDDVQLDYIIFSDMTQLRASYLNAVFRSPTIRLAENINELNVHQMCSALAVDANFDELQETMRRDPPTFYYSEGVGKPWVFPQFKGITPKEIAIS